MREKVRVLGEDKFLGKLRDSGGSKEIFVGGQEVSGK